MKKCPNCGACQECGHVPHMQPWPQPYVQPYVQPVYPWTSQPWRYTTSGGSTSGQTSGGGMVWNGVGGNPLAA